MIYRKFLILLAPLSGSMMGMFIEGEGTIALCGLAIGILGFILYIPYFNIDKPSRHNPDILVLYHSWPMLRRIAVTFCLVMIIIAFVDSQIIPALVMMAMLYFFYFSGRDL